MQTRWAWWAYNFDSAVIPAAGPVGAVQYNGDPYLAGEAAFSYDDVTNVLSVPSILFNSQPLVFGIADSANYGEPSLVIKGDLVNGASAIVSVSYTDPNNWAGLLLFHDGTDAYISASDSGASTGDLYLQADNIRLDPSGSGIIEIDGNIVATNGKSISAGQTAGNQLYFSAYDTGDASYHAIGALTSGATPTFALAPGAGDDVVITNQNGGSVTVIANTVQGTVSITSPILQLPNGGTIRGTISAGDTFTIQAYDGGSVSYVTFVTITNNDLPSFVLSPPAGGATITVKANTLAAVADVSGTAAQTTITNGTAAAGANAYVIQGGQAPATVNTGWIKIYVGTAAAWVPYWANATP